MSVRNGHVDLRALTPEQLAARAQKGSLDAYARLVELFEERLFNFLLRRVGSRTDAEDLTQESFLRAWRRIRSYRPRWRFSTWLYTIATRLAISHARAAVRHTRLGDEDSAPAAPTPAPAADPGVIWKLVDEVLTAEQRTAVWLRYVEDLAIAEIGAVMGKSQVAVRVMLFRARAALEAALGQSSTGTERDVEAPAPVIRTGAGRPVAGGIR